ncbi:efflux RND transporter periplasmic adaptor subunit [Coraliomargarita akajimensis]|uniref:Efflux transporter, RND family, MFP subunit n=1 Tax=Coraliomargarita akajimensis (strain DSM 45221 / IAM 15411 / JCM 23193 / KCTC 12865 / 04OKA010-24) TaxID=583355 RepID=D5EJS0_CORAD|nr:efflux RND transporter periplasmic adaptor subunit [Coraliomargarita akajimensis]ADE54669.1 efflux transporter, RND family, MFP subunit [Coraliomargarita akajimensis DSM 45221]
MKIVIRILIILGILTCALLLARVLISTGPVSERRERPPMQVVVEVQPVPALAPHVNVEGMGTVIAARELTLRTQVSGKVVEVSPELLEGHFVDKGESLARIETADYELMLAQAESALAQRKSELAIEMGQQKVAKREWELLRESGSARSEIDASLALREPQLKQAQALHASAEAAVKQAQIDLARTQLQAPFNAVVLSKSIELGAIATTNTEIARIASTDSFHIQVSIPESQVPHIEIPGAHASIRIRGSDTDLEGTAISLLSEVDPEGRMARILVEVKDPLGLNPQNSQRPKLLLGTYVEVRLKGKQLENSIEIPRNTLHNGDVVWLMRPDDNTLEIRPVEVAWRNRDTVLIRSGLTPGEQLITTQLSLASDGMSLRLPGQTAPTAKPQQSATN